MRPPTNICGPIARARHPRRADAQDEVASTIAQQIDVELTPNEQARFAQPRPVNPDALEACLKGQYFMLKQTSDGFQKANEYSHRRSKSPLTSRRAM